MTSSTLPLAAPVAVPSSSGRPLALLVPAVLVALAIALRPSPDDVASMAWWLRAHGLAGAGLLMVAYVVAALAALPVAAVTMLAGFAFGLGTGLAVVVPAGVVGALAAFGLGRSLFRQRLEARLGRDRRFAAIDRAIGDQGLRLTLLLRLSPVLPFGVLNYALSATSVRARSFLAATALGIIPGNLMYLYLGTLVGTAGDGGPARQALLWGGLAATVLAVVFVTRAARRALRRAEAAAATAA